MNASTDRESGEAMARSRLHSAFLLLMAILLIGGVAPGKASASLGDNYGVAGAKGAAWPEANAWWAGTCNLESPSTANGGVGVPPSTYGTCIDPGKPYFPPIVEDPKAPLDLVWPPGEEPGWRLDPETQAGGHPDAAASFWLNRAAQSDNGMLAQSDGDTRNVVVRLPAGFVGNPSATPKCPSHALQTTPPRCHPSTQIGYITLTLGILSVDEPAIATVFPVWNVEPRDGVTAEFMLSPGATGSERTNTSIVAKARTDGDYGVDTFVMNIPSAVPLLGQTITLWSVPWSGAHDIYRPREGYTGHFPGGNPRAGMPVGGLTGTNHHGEPTAEQAPQSYDPSWGPIKPFFSNPSRCGAPGSTTLQLESWHLPGLTKSYQSEGAPIDGCDALDPHFKPDISLKPTVHAADSPTGLDVELSIPQNNDLPFDPPQEGAPQGEIDDYVEAATAYWKSNAGLATPNLRDTVVKLPEGLAVNPAAASGQAACSSQQIGLKTSSGAMPSPIRFDNSDPGDGIGNDCPDASKIGTVQIETPLLDEEDWPSGEVYLASQYDNPFNSLLAIYAVIRSPKRGFLSKLAGVVTADPVTGRLETRFLNNPQLPFSKFKLRFKAGPQAPLATPVTCGDFSIRTELTPWSANEASDTVVVEKPEVAIAAGANGSGCVATPAQRSFAVGFEAGAASPLAGAHAPFTLRLTRPDGAQEIQRLEMKTPRGFTASLRGVPYCSEAQIQAATANTGRAEQAASSCHPASQVGTVLSGAGAGPSPLYVGGRLYLAGPHNGAPLSMVAVIPAVAGPFDLGVVVVRTALRVDPANAQITAVTDPLPTILQGIPLRIRDIRVSIDRPNFALNPTSCAEQYVSAEVFGASGARATVSDRFEVGNCAALGFKPHLGFRLRGGTRRGDHPSLRAILRARPGDANIGRVAVTIPRSQFLDQSHIRTICTRVQFAAGNCPKGSIYGYATAWSPLLDKPLRGPVYLRSSNHNLPDMVGALRGQINIEVAGRIDSHKGQIRNTFDVVPDAAVSRFVLTLKGGKMGLLVNSRNLCVKPSRAAVRMRGHNGRRHNFRPLMRNDCKKNQRKERRAGQRGK